MNLTLLAAVNFFKKKNRFRITARLSEKTARSLSNHKGYMPLGSDEYILTKMIENGNPPNNDFLSHLQMNASELKQATTAAAKGKSYWHRNKFTQEYRIDRLTLNPQVEIYYQKLGLAEGRKKTTIGDSLPTQLSWDS